MSLRYYIDGETGLPRIYNHRVEEHEVEDILLRPGEDRPGEGGARVALGQTRAGLAGDLCARSRAGQRVCHYCIRAERKVTQSI